MEITLAVKILEEVAKIEIICMMPTLVNDQGEAMLNEEDIFKIAEAAKAIKDAINDY